MNLEGLPSSQSDMPDMLGKERLIRELTCICDLVITGQRENEIVCQPYELRQDQPSEISHY